jgi:hypothetical protein
MACSTLGNQGGVPALNYRQDRILSGRCFLISDYVASHEPI